MTEDPRVYTVADIARILRIAPTTVRVKARTGVWPYLPIGPQTMRFTEAHLNTILTTNAAPPTPTRNTRRTRRTP